MIADLERQVDAICESMEQAKDEFEQAAILCAEAIKGIHDRLERIETWMQKEQDAKVEKAKTKIRMIDAKKQ